MHLKRTLARAFAARHQPFEVAGSMAEPYLEPVDLDGHGAPSSRHQLDGCPPLLSSSRATH